MTLSSRSRWLATLLTLVSATIAADTTSAQTTKVIPAHLATKSGDLYLAEPFGFDGVRFQQLINGASVCQTSATIDEVAMRVTTEFGNSFPFIGRTIPSMTVSLGSTTASQKTMSTSFMTNRGPTTVVHTGAFNLPTVMPGPIPANWDIRIKFARKVTYARSAGNLLLEIEIPGVRNVAQFYFLDGDGGTGGKTRTFGSAGIYRQTHGPGIDSNEVALRVGGSALLTIAALAPVPTPPPPPAFAAVGFSDKRYGPLPLPFDLRSLGANGNHVYVSLDVFLPVTLQRLPIVSGFLGLTILPLPNDPNLAGFKLYSQGLLIDAPSNQLGIVFTNALELTIAKGVEPPTRCVFAPDTTATTGKFGAGTFHKFGGPTLRLSGTFR